MNGSYAGYRQASPALACPPACCQIMDLQQLNDALQSLRPAPQTDNVHAHRLTQTVAEILDGSQAHNALVLRLTRFPLATCLALEMESYVDPVPHPVRGH